MGQKLGKLEDKIALNNLSLPLFLFLKTEFEGFMVSLGLRKVRQTWSSGCGI